MLRTWPGDWKAVVKHLVAEDRTAICIIDFIIARETMTGISMFEMQGGRFVKAIDYWPEPYQPPRRVSGHMKRRTECGQNVHSSGVPSTAAECKR